MHGRRSIYYGGFTLIEMLVVVALMTLLGAIGFGQLSGFANSKGLDASSRAVVATFEEARSQTLAAREDTQYGVHITSTSFTIFPGDTYSAGNAANKVVPLSSNVTLTSSALSGGASNVVFARLTGTASATGTITLSLAKDSSKTHTITIYASGIVEP